MVSKVTISLPDDLLERIDAEASSRGESRSFIVQEASACYLAQTAEERAQRARKARLSGAIAEMKRIAAAPVLDARPSLEILREVRETHDSAPLRGKAAPGETDPCGGASDAGL